MIIRFFPTLLLCPPARQHLLESPFLNQKILSSKRKEQLSQMAVTFIRIFTGSISQSYNPQISTDYSLRHQATC